MARDQFSEPFYINFRASRFSYPTSHNAGGKNAGGKTIHSKLGACTEMLCFTTFSRFSGFAGGNNAGGKKICGW